MSYKLETFENKPRKRMLEDMIGKYIHFSLDPTDRSNGMSIFSLTGPAIEQHYNNYKPLLGSNGVLHSIERDKYVFLAQLEQLKDLPRDKVKAEYGEFFDYTIRVVGKHKHVYVEYDACDSLCSIVKESLEKIRELANSLTKQHTVWFSVTYTLRAKGNQYNDNKLKKIRNAFTMGKLHWECTHQETFTYKDGAPMATTLFKFER